MKTTLNIWLIALLMVLGKTATAAESASVPSSALVNVVLVQVETSPEAVAAKRFEKRNWTFWGQTAPRLLARLEGDLGRTRATAAAGPEASLYGVRCAAASLDDTQNLKPLAEHLDAISKLTGRPGLLLVWMPNQGDVLLGSLSKEDGQAGFSLATLARIQGPHVLTSLRAASPAVAPPCVVASGLVSEVRTPKAARLDQGLGDSGIESLLHTATLFDFQKTVENIRAERAPQLPPGAEIQSAVVYWDGVNACKPSDKPGYQYIWQKNADNLISSLQSTKGEFAAPFGIMSRSKPNSETVAADLDAYLTQCRVDGKRPFIVMAPDLNIQGYAASVAGHLSTLTLPAKIAAEGSIKQDMEWTRSFSPIVLEKLSKEGYSIHGITQSYGATTAGEGIKSGNSHIDTLTVMNGRADMTTLDALEEGGRFTRLSRITTFMDAPTLPGKAAWGKDGIYMKQASVEGWGNPWVDHNVPIGPGSTKVTIEVAGREMKTDLGHVLRSTMEVQTPSSFSASALPGDLIVRYGKNLLGPPLVTAISGGRLDDIPHVGVVVDPKKYGFSAVDLELQPVENKTHGVIKPVSWNDAKQFQNAGYFSVLEANIPVKHNGVTTSFRGLPDALKTDIRQQVQERLALDALSGKDVGEYRVTSPGKSAQCFDYPLAVYDDVLKRNGVQVLRYEGASSFINWRPDKPINVNDRSLTRGTLRDWFVVGEPLATVIHGDRTATWTDPSKINDKLPRVGAPILSDQTVSKLTIPTYWTESGRPQSATEAGVLPAMVNGRNKALVVGTGPEVDILYRGTVSRLGKENVLRIDTPFYDRNPVLEQQAKTFGADAILAVKQPTRMPASQAPEIKLEKPRPPEVSSLKKPSDIYPPGGPPPPPPPPPPAVIKRDDFFGGGGGSRFSPPGGGPGGAGGFSTPDRYRLAMMDPVPFRSDYNDRLTRALATPDLMTFKSAPAIPRPGGILFHPELEIIADESGMTTAKAE